MRKQSKVEIPPEGHRKYGWAIDGVKPPQKFVFDAKDGDRAAKAARAWAYRNDHLNLRVVVRKGSDSTAVFFVKKVEVRNGNKG